jgi:hypothetical protein
VKKPAEPPVGTSYRAVAKRLGSTSDGHWRGKWRPLGGARKQAQRWAQIDDTVEVWIEEGSYSGVGRVELVQRHQVSSDDRGHAPAPADAGA